MVKIPTDATAWDRRQKIVGCTTDQSAPRRVPATGERLLLRSLSAPCHGRRASASYGALKLCGALRQVRFWSGEREIARRLCKLSHRCGHPRDSAAKPPVQSG